MNLFYGKLKYSMEKEGLSPKKSYFLRASLSYNKKKKSESFSK